MEYRTTSPILRVLAVIGVGILTLLPFNTCTNQIRSEQDEKAGLTVPDSVRWYVRMVDSEISRRGNSLEYGGSDPKAKWNYQTGLFLKATLAVWERTRQPKYLGYVKQVVDSFLEEDGTIKTYKMTDYNLDKLNSGKVLLALYRITGEEKYRDAAETLRRQLEGQPRTMAGGFWHKQRYPWQMWLDGIYMSGPFYAEFSRMFSEPESYDDVIKQILVIDAHTRDRETGLRYHAWDESRKQLWANRETGCSPHFWGRAMGWYSMALVDVLDFLPHEHPKREQVLYILRDVAQSIRNYQDDSSGLWWQVLDLGERRGNYLEASASAMFVYALAKGIRKGYLDAEYRTTVERGYHGLQSQLVELESDGSISLAQICSVAGLGGDPYRDGSFDYYISEPVVRNDLKGVGPFILASLEMEEPPAGSTD